MILLYVISLATLVICQYMEQGVQPDLAFGQQNDRFDLTGLIPKTDFRVDYEEPRRAGYEEPRRAGYEEPRRAGALNRRRRLRNPPARRVRYPRYRRDDDWEDLSELTGPRGGAEDYDIYTRAQDYRRQRRQEELMEMLRAGNKPAPPVKKPAPQPPKPAPPPPKPAPQPAKPAPQPAAAARAGTPNTREISLMYSLPIKIKVQDLPNGSYITGINIL